MESINEINKKFYESISRKLDRLDLSKNEYDKLYDKLVIELNSFYETCQKLSIPEFGKVRVYSTSGEKLINVFIDELYTEEV